MSEKVILENLNQELQKIEDSFNEGKMKAFGMRF